MFSLSDNVVHLGALMGLLVACVLLVIFGHSYINSDYVFGTVTTLAGALFGYRFGAGSVTSPTIALAAPVEQLAPQNGTPPSG